MKVYLDNSATTALDPDVLREMTPYFTDVFGNANSLHGYGREAAKAVNAARDRVAAALGCKSSEVYFTSGGTESDNWALKGIARKHAAKGRHIVISSIEHPAILSAAEQLEREGFEIARLPVNADGIVEPQTLAAALRPDTILVSVMLVNNEIGTVQPIRELAALAHANGSIVHTDAVQAIGNLPVDVGALGVDLLSLSAHKFYGPKGVGVLYKKTGVGIEPLVAGGHQERTMRGGTTNVPGVVGLGAAIERATADLDAVSVRLKAIRDRFVERVLTEIPETLLNGSLVERVPGNANISFRYIEGESILSMLDMRGIAVSTGSACSSGSLEPSHVILALGRTIPQAHSSIRFSFGRHNTAEEADYVVEQLKTCIATLRAMSPLCN